MTSGGLVGAVMILVSAVTLAATPPDEQPVKDSDGKTLAVTVLCSDCQAPGSAGKPCRSGVQTGWFKGKPCGQCLMQHNADVAMEWPYDLHITGTLTDEKGQPLKGEFVKLFMPMGWTVRTVTSEQGKFRLTIGATHQPRKSRTPLVTDLGTRVTSPQGKTGNYAIFLVPESYKECSEADVPKAGTPTTDAHPPAGKKKMKAH